MQTRRDLSISKHRERESEKKRDIYIYDSYPKNALPLLGRDIKNRPKL